MTSHNSRTQDLYQVKLAIQAHSKRAQEGTTYKPPPPQNNSNLYDRHVQSNERHQQPSHEARAPERNGTGKIVNINIPRNEGLTHPNFVPGKVSKSSSRAQVPDLISTIKPKTPVATQPERNLSLAHRRSQSETNNRTSTREKSANHSEAVASDKPRLAEIKSRYMEPKTRQRATALKNQTNLPLRQRNISSSDSSRTTSPVITTRRKELIAPANKKPTAIESISMSRDSLASPAKANRLTKAASGVSCNEYDRSIDSLGDSLRSSLKTDETKSQESLVHLEERKAKEAMAKNPTQRTANANVNKENVLIIPANQSFAARKAVNKKLTITTKALSTAQSNSTNSSPSSVTQKGRLSSTSSVSSPRDSQPKLRQLTPGSAPTAKPAVRKSFLSARSKEILAKKDALKQSESAKSVPTIIREKINASVNKSSSTSNILSKRPMSIPPTTLHMRRTAKLSVSSATSVTSNGSQHSLMNPTKSSSMKMVVQNNKMNKEKLDVKKVTKAAKNECDLYENGRDHNSGADGDNMIIKPVGRIESKLERSSTFCKEVSDLPPSELQVIE